MEKITKLSLEYEKYVNNSTKHKRQANQHNINKNELETAYKTYSVFYENTLNELNAEFDIMGFSDLKNYEKWLLNVQE